MVSYIYICISACHEPCFYIFSYIYIGVHEVAIHRQKQKVTIIGDVNPLKLVKYIAKMGKKTELLVYDKKPKIGAQKPAERRGNTRQYSHVDDNHPYCKATNDSFPSHFNYESSSSDRDADSGEQHRRGDQFHSAHNNNKYRGKKKVEEEEFFHSVPPPNHQQYSHGRRNNEGAKPRHGQFYGRSRNANYEYAHEPANFQFHEAKFEEEIKEAKRDMNRFFTGAGSSAYHHHHHDHYLPRPNYSQWTSDHQHYGDRNHPHPPPPPLQRVYSARPGTHYDKFTNFFSDENPSSCTIV